jgi:tRNA 5-methylaminomethyl-2-thiouridine biosynthesis bifunctional protein
VLVGATYDESSDPSTDPLNDLSNAGRLARALGWDPATIARCCDSAVVGMRWNSPDRLPLIGELPDTERVIAMDPELLRNDRLPVPRNAGLFMIGALGSRGLLWSVLGAQIIAAYLEGWPSPIETDLLRAVDPTRRVRANLRHLPSAR